MRDQHEGTQLPPHALEAEQAIIGSLFLDNAAVDDIRGEVDADDFYIDAHKIIFEHQLALLAKSEPVDVVTIEDSLTRAGKCEFVGGLTYLGALIANVPTSANARQYARIVHEKAQRRRIMMMAERVRDFASRSTDDSDELRARVDSLVEAVKSDGSARWKLPGPITADEFTLAHTSPDCIVENYLFADVALIAAPGGVGKTTLLLYETAHIVLGLPLYGNTIHKPGPVLIVTAEDSRNMLVARLRHIADALQLDAGQIATVLRDVRIADVSGEAFKMTMVADDVVVPAPLVDVVIAQAITLRPVVVVLDPAVSFGIGEQRVNDAEQGLVEAARRIRNALGCCVRYVHHTGKGNAREKTTDQYTGRGGSALPDGCRMVAVLQPMTANEWQKATGASLIDGEQGMVLTRPKLSYCAPQPDILITRKGYAFTHTGRADPDPAADLEANCRQVFQLIETAIAKGEQPTQNSLESRKVMPMRDLRGAIAMLISRGAIRYVETHRKGGPQRYLTNQAATDSPVAPSGETP
ncbi:MAG: AAA family ATPase [Burkholderiales bacterium]|nr:AAA family ATPase [Burkholderiales bacterium]